MKVAIVFDAPDELAGANLSPEEFLRAYNERLFGIKITGIDMPKHYNLAAQVGEKVLVIMDAERKPLTSVVTTLEGTGITARDLEQIKELPAPIPPMDQLAEHAKELHFALENHAAVVEDLKVDDVDYRERKEARDRRQQHKFAVKFSNRRK